MSTLRTMSPSLAVATQDAPRTGASVEVFGPQDRAFLHRVVRLAEDYPHPHSIFGGPDAGNYVRTLADRQRFSGEGWFGADGPDGLAAVHLGVYGVGDGRGHSLFKLRHPLSEGPRGLDCLAEAIDAARRAAGRIRPGTQKLVVFLGEDEGTAREAAERVGFRLEGTLHDYYRLGERCLVLGQTVGDAIGDPS